MTPSEGAGTITIGIGDLKRGGDAAAQPLWEHYFDRLVRLARSRLRKLRGQRAFGDAEDAALSAFDSFCQGAKRGQYPQLKDRDDLWRLLVVITKRKVADQVRAEMAKKRGEGKVLGGEGLDHFVDPEPSPEFAAMMADEVRYRLNALGDERSRRIVAMRMEGYTDDEIARHLGYTRRTVQRELALIRKEWSEG
jgi:DNA-directed RNA polymerase specialized sigma24 family protein